MNRAWATTVAVDAAVVVLFAVIGRLNHDEGLTLAGVARTAWPFLVGAGVGLALAAFAHDDPRSLRAGVRVWLFTVVVGMVLRKLTGAGTDAAFVAVATLVLGALFLGWRLATRVRRWTRPFGRLRA